MLSREQLYKLYTTDRERFVDLYKHVRELQIKMARTDINAFIAYVMKEERVTKGSKEGAKLVQEQTHIELQAHVDKYQKTLIWGALGIGKCVSSWTRFTLEDGRVVNTLRLKEMLEYGQEVRVWTLDKVTMQPRLVRVKSISDNGIVNTIRVKTASGHSTLVSEPHPFWMLRNGEWDWKSADQLESLYQVRKRGEQGDAMRLMVHYGVPDYPRTLQMENQEAFDLGFVVMLMKARSVRSVLAEHRHRDVAYACIGEGHPAWDRRFEMVRTLIEIGDRRGLHVGAAVYPKSIRLEIYGLSKWVAKYGLQVKHRQVRRKRRWNGEVYHKVVTSMESCGIAIKDIHKYNQDAVRSYFAGCYAVDVRDTGEDAHPGIMRPHGPSSKKYRTRRIFQANWSIVCNAAGVGVRRHPNGAVYLEGKLMIKVAAEVSQRAPALAVHFDSIAEKFEHDHRHVEGADARANRSHGVPIDKWIPRADHGPDVSAITYVRRSRFKHQTWGVEIDDEDHTHLTDGILTHNTQQISVARSLFALGNNVNIRILIVQSTADLAKDILHQIKEMIEKSTELHEVFPNLKRGDLWQSREVRVQRTNLTILTPSIRAIGVETKIDGSRYDLIIVDDALSYENTRTQTERDNLYKWLISVPFSREEDWTWTIVIGNAWHHEDAMHRLEKLKEWHARRFPARDPKTGQTLLPKRWPMDRIAKWEGSRPPAEVRRSLDCTPYSNETSRFDSAWFDRAFARGIDILKDDDGKPVFWLQRYNLKAEQKKVELERQKIAEANLSVKLKSERKDPRSARMPVSVMSGVDLGFGLTEESDFSVIFTAVFFDNGEVLPIMIDKGRYGPTEIIPRIINTHLMYGATIFVETSFTQKWVYDTISKQHPDIPVFPWKTEGRGQIGNKWDMIFGVESVAFDIGSDRWTLPCIGIESKYEDIKFEAHEIMLEFKDACLSFVPDSAVHTNDLLMAAWIMLQGARLRGSQEYLVALSDIGSMYSQYREEFESYETPQSDESRWGKEIATDLREYLEAAGLDYFYNPE